MTPLNLLYISGKILGIHCSYGFGHYVTKLHVIRNPNLLGICHFHQLRTQALASLHSGLQNNQGLPVSHVANWLAMEVFFSWTDVDECFLLFPFFCLGCGRIFQLPLALTFCHQN